MNEQSQISKSIIAETDHLRFVDRGGWSYIERKNSNGVVCVAALTSEDEVLLIEQYRPPVDCSVIELPAGLSGDLADQADEELEEAARRELLEETGYRATTLRRHVDLASSAGLTNEVVTMFIAEGLEKVAAGGGDDSEDIVVHKIPIDGVAKWLARAQVDGKLIDARVYAGVHFLGNNKSDGKK